MEAHGHVTAADVELPDASDDGAPEPDVIDQEQATRGHGSESFFILGEGLVSTARGGREDASAQPAAAGRGGRPGATVPVHAAAARRAAASRPPRAGRSRRR